MLDDASPPDEGNRQTLGVIDGTATQLALGGLMLIPTALSCIFWPRALEPMLDTIEPQGRRGLFLAPGAFFLIIVLTMTILAASLDANSGGALAAIGRDVRGAVSEGDVWRIAALILPLFFGATMIGVLATGAGKLAGIDRWTLTAGVRSGFYGLFGIGFFVAFSEPFTRGLGDPGNNGVVEPAVATVACLASTWFYGSLLSRRSGWKRASITGALTGLPLSLFLIFTYAA